jgi:CubicO group peptidase (beta-lactamase class C family)
MNNKSSIIWILVFLLISGNIIIAPVESQTNKQTDYHISHIDDFIISEMEKKHIPGLSASVVIGDNVIWKGAYGYADIENNIKVTNDTLFKIASVSKTITATALMQLYEKGLFDLYEPINDYLPFEIIHPDYPSNEITFYMLLTHSSSIVDNWNYLFYFVGDAPISFQDFLEEYLVIGGVYYDSDNNFGSWKPGTKFSYSNIAVALIGYLVEIISNTDFIEYCEINLFDKLEMNESAWYLRDLNISHIAMPYYRSDGEYVPYGHIGYVDVPAGDLRTSSFQLIHFLTMFINKGIYNSENIISEEMIDLMLTPQTLISSNIGLIWWRSSIGGRLVWGHSGSDFGYRAMMQFNNSTKIGVVVLINGESGISNIVDALFDYAENIFSNIKPDKPEKPDGNIKGKIGGEYNYSTISSDPNGDNLYYKWDWGDEISGWIGPLPSGEICHVKHIWNNKGDYEIRVKAKDIYDEESDWSEPLEISMPKNKQDINTLYVNLFLRIWFVRGLFKFLDEDDEYIYLYAISAKLRGFGTYNPYYYFHFRSIRLAKPFIGFLFKGFLPSPGIGICRSWNYFDDEAYN